MRLGAATIALMLAGPALAQAQPSTQELLEQIRLLQKRIEQLEAAGKQRQATAAKVRVAAQQPAAPPAPPAPPAAVSTPVAAPPPGEPDKPNGTFTLGSVKLTLGGFIDLTGYHRSRNENRGTGTGYATIPFHGPTPQGNSGEFGLSAQQTRLSATIEAPIGADSRIVGYGEMDFNNGAGGANAVQSNSYTPRLRQAFGQYEDESWQAYLLAGQAWTLATPFRKGLDPFETWQPPVIDHNYMVGYSYLRVPMVRLVKGFGNFWRRCSRAIPAPPASIRRSTTASTSRPTSSPSSPSTPSSGTSTSSAWRAGSATRSPSAPPA